MGTQIQSTHYKRASLDLTHTGEQPYKIHINKDTCVSVTAWSWSSLVNWMMFLLEHQRGELGFERSVFLLREGQVMEALLAELAWLLPYTHPGYIEKYTTTHTHRERKRPREKKPGWVILKQTAHNCHLNNRKCVDCAPRSLETVSQKSVCQRDTRACCEHQYALCFINKMLTLQPPSHGHKQHHPHMRKKSLICLANC